MSITLGSYCYLLLTIFLHLLAVQVYWIIIPILLNQHGYWSSIKPHASRCAVWRATSWGEGDASETGGFFLNAFWEPRKWGLLIKVYSLEYCVNTAKVV